MLEIILNLLSKTSLASTTVVSMYKSISPPLAVRSTLDPKIHNWSVLRKLFLNALIMASI